MVGGEGVEYACKYCGEKRFFCLEVSVTAKQRIDLKNGPKNKKVYDIELNSIDGFYEDVVYCGKCNEQVDMSEWIDFNWTDFNNKE